MTSGSSSIRPDGVRRTGRAARFNLNPPLDVLSRPFGMRFYTFSMSALNVSRTGFFLQAQTSGFIPYRIGSLIHVTIDMQARTFSRPIHMILRVERLEDRHGRQGFGCSITEIMESHGPIFEQGLGSMGDKDRIQS